MLYALLAVVIVAPFEWALVTLPGQMTLTSVELITLVALGTYALALSRSGRAMRPAVSTVVAVAAVGFLVSLTVSALTTSFHPANALRFVGRMAMASALCVAAARTISTHARAQLVAAVMLAVAAVVGAIAVLEALQVPAVMSALTAFRPGFHVVAGQLRATSTLSYPTIASMYLEVAFVIGLWLLLSSRHGAPRTLAFAALVLIGAGISATFTRAGLLAISAALITVVALRLSRVSRARADLGVLTALAIALTATVFLAHSPELLAARMTTEGSGAWYGAEYDVPHTATMTTAGLHRVPVVITNTGQLTWDSEREPAFALSYHWLWNEPAMTNAVVEFEGQRTPFPATVRPGQRIRMLADVIAPGEPGAYTLVWDVVHESRAWLSTEGVPSARTVVVVTGAPQAPVARRMTQLPPAMMRPSRPELWSAALRIAAEHPVLGIGPDNYRLAYGTYLGDARWDPRVHANNMYLELLTGAGALGLIALLVLLSSVGYELWRRARSATPEAHVGTSAALALWVVIAGHGLVDSFLSFTTTYVTFAIAAGWALSNGILEGARDAHRV